MALRAGATLYTELPSSSVGMRSRYLPGSRLSLRQAQATLASISYLASYAGMGMAELVCMHGCVCSPQTIDAHSATLNASVYLTHSFPLVESGGQGGRPCAMVLMVLSRTSSGEHKFKVRHLTLSSA